MAASSQLFPPLFLRAHIESDRRTFRRRRDSRVAAAATPFPSRFSRKEMTDDPNTSNHGEDAKDRQHDGISKIHRGLFNPGRRDVKSRTAFSSDS